MCRSFAVAVLLLSVVYSSPAPAQARALVTGSPQRILLASTIGGEVVLGSVRLGKPNTFTTFNIQAAGTIEPDPEQQGAGFELRFLICDQPDCGGELRSAIRIQSASESGTATPVVATGSFGVSSHNARPVVLTGFQPHTSSGDLYLAVSLRLMRSPATTPFRAKLNLLRVEVMP
jgi:hypothetical protein